MNAVATALKMVELRKEQLADAKDAVVTAVANTFLACQKCGGRTKIKTLTLIQTHWYESPHGCTGGDLWHSGESQVRCPKCGFVNRDCFGSRLKSQTNYPNAFLNIEQIYNR